MAGPRWDPTSVKALLRLTSQRLGQLQEKKDSKATVTRRDIASLLQHGNVRLARVKAQNLMQEDVSADLLEILEMHIGVLLEHFTEIDQEYVNSPMVVEAASSVIFAGVSQPECKELLAVRDLLIQQLGQDFARSAVANRDNHVSARVVHALSTPSPTAAGLDMYLLNIAKTYGVPWMPERPRHDILKLLSEILDPDALPAVDMPRLRRLCARGLPDEPPWLRARVWKLFLGTLPVLKSSWSRESRQQRDSYYDLVRRLLKPFSDLPPPTTPLAQLDSSLLAVSQQLSRIPAHLFADLSDEPDQAGLCPLNENAPDEIKIPYANSLDVRLKAIRERDRDSCDSAPSIPEIRFESNTNAVPQISVTAPETRSLRRQDVPSRTSVAPQPSNVGELHPKHLSAFLRVLYLHSVINPGNLSPYISALLVPLYSVLNQEIEREDMSHVEADTFWLFEAMIGEFSELEDEGGNVWTKKFSERLTWADSELAESLHVKGLDPALPHYSYRWLAPLLTQTLPLPSVLVIWDAIFSCPMRERDKNPKLDYLLDIGTAMLIRSRTALFRLGKGGRRSPNLWGEENTSVPPPSPLRAWEFGDAFMEGMSLLQHYPIEVVGGVDLVLQTASDLFHRRQDETKVNMVSNLSLGARLRTTMWKGLTNQMPSPDPSPPESEDQQDDVDSHKSEDDDTADDAPPSGLTARLANSVWRGITNKSSMEPPPTPITPVSPAMPPSPIRSPWPSSKEEPSETQPKSPVSSTLWNYAEKLKDSDAAAKIAKALLRPWGVGGPSSVQSTQGSPQNSPPMKSSPELGYTRRVEEGRHASLPIMGGTEGYSLPPRPAFFRPPRDSFIGPSSRTSSPPRSPPWSPQSEGGFRSRTRDLQESFAILTRSSTPPPVKSGPRPLLLNSSNLMTTSARRHESVSGSGQFADSQWQHVQRNKGHNLHRDSISQSSASSLSPLDVVDRGWRPTKSELNEFAPSRRVALNRRSFSPMAPTSRTRPTSGSSSGTSQVLGPPTNSSKLAAAENSRDVVDSDNTNGAIPTPDPQDFAPNMLGLSEDTTDSERPIISPRIRSKRYPSRLANIRTEDLAKPKSEAEQRRSPQTLSADWPEQTQDALATTPKASTFEDTSPPSSGRRKSSTDQTRKMSGESHESRIRKVSGDSRPRKASTGTIREGYRDSAAEEGDDEGGYDEFLSAYESEDGSFSHT
ncbi:regulator of Vps4 activity in the MVB pathway-domain-containing protein [Mycena pura]|uniref:Regulator of Vps4 activity in the MVB pathway-domain-containing protein n=1 Tax=Mycena pura TaxID=153505 RepID=A0AAD6VTC2_9AGAR|nr:regulator of Vps4 activity in the MVB pathway-domain-containing protein [Mycena pura]